MNIKDLDYCNPSWNKKMEKILRFAYPEMKWDSIVEIYLKMKNEFDGVSGPEMLAIDRFPFFSETLLEGIQNEYASQEYTIGIDLPVWISSKENFNDKYVMILGEDPLRSDNFQEQNENGKIIISSPFGTHSEIRRRRYNSLMWKISKRILEVGYGLYFTDINKLWIGKHDKESRSNKKTRTKKLNLPEGIQNQFKVTLLKEIELINPVMSLAFGKVAEGVLSNLTKEKEICFKSFPHTAARAKDWIKYTSDKPAIHDNIVEAVISTIPTKGNAD